MQIPWRLKSQAFYLVDNWTGHGPLYFAQKHITKGSKVSIPAIPREWDFHKANLEEFRCGRVLEFGAGKSLAQNIYLSQLGVPQTVVDLFPMLDFQQVNDAIDQLSAHGVPTHGHVSALDDLWKRYHINYLAPADMRRSTFAAGGFDAVISTNTLEHIPQDDIAAIWREARRILSPGGIVSSKIDYSDHYAHSDRSLSITNFLRFTDEQWAKHNHRSHYQNRLRHREQIGLLKAAGFEIVSEYADNLRATGHRPPDPETILPRFLSGDPSDLMSDGLILARKPG